MEGEPGEPGELGCWSREQHWSRSHQSESGESALLAEQHQFVFCGTVHQLFETLCFVEIISVLLFVLRNSFSPAALRCVGIICEFETRLAGGLARRWRRCRAGTDDSSVQKIAVVPVSPGLQ